MTSSSSMDPQGPDLETILSQLTVKTTSNEQRSQAELLLINKHIQAADPKEFAKKLGNILGKTCHHFCYEAHSRGLAARAMSSLLLRDLFNQNGSQDLQETLVQLVNWAVLNEQNKPIIKILAGTISKLAADNGLPEDVTLMLLQLLEADNKLDDEKLVKIHEPALIIVAELAQDVGDSRHKARLAQDVGDSQAQHKARLAQDVGNSLLQHKARFHTVFMKCFMNYLGSADEVCTPSYIKKKIAVLSAALSAAINFILCLESSSDRDMFQDLLLGMIQCLEINVLLNAGEKVTEDDATMLKAEYEKMVQKALVLLIELAWTEPWFFRGQLVEVVRSMLQIAKPKANNIAEAENLEQETRHLAIKFVITLAEMMRDLPQLIISWLFAILMMMLSDAGESSNYSVELECLHRLTSALGGNTIAPIAYAQLHTYLHSLKWQERLAGLVALAQVAKECSQVDIPHLEQVVTMVCDSFRDHPDHPRVRLAAIDALGELSNCVGPSLLDQYHNRVFGVLDSALNGFENPRAKARVASVVFKIKISATCPTHILEPYLDGILSKLIVLPQTPRNIQVLRLANSLNVSTNVKTREMSAILLGEMFKEPLAALTKHLVKYILLRCVEEEHERSVMKSLCHTIATFYNAFCIETGWPELISFVEGCVYSGSGRNLSYNDSVEAAMLILGPLIKYHPKSLRCYGRYLKYKYSAEIRIAAFGAAIGYIRCTRDEHLVPAMTQMLNEGLNEGEEVTTQKALKLLIEWANQTKHPWFSGELSMSYFSKSQLVWFVSSAIEIAESQRLKKETRHLAIDFMITLGCDHELMINKLFWILMSDIENEAASQGAENENDDAGVSRSYSVVLKFLNRLAFILDELDEYSVAWPVLQWYLVAPEWEKRVAAIVALAQISKVLKEIKNNFDHLVTLLLDLFQDSHHRVRLAAINAFDQLFTDLDPDLQLQYHRRVLPALAQAIYDFRYPQVQEYAASAMINISENYPPDTLTPYMSKTVGSLLEEYAASAMINISKKNWIPDILIRYLPETVSFLLKFLRRKRIASIKNLVKQFQAKLLPDTWASTRSGLLDQQSELLSILDKEESM